MNTKKYVAALVALLLLLGAAGCGSEPEPETGFTAIDDLQTLLDRITRTLSGVRSTATAEEALPVLEMISGEFAGLIDRLPNLTPTARKEMAEQAARAMPGLRDNARRINNSEGLDVLGRTMNKLVGQLSQML